MKRIPYSESALFIALSLALSSPARALDAPRLPPSQSDFGGSGLLQMPSGRMGPEGEFSVNASVTNAPYNRYAVTLQPLDWLETTIRYTDITNRLYGSEELSGDQSYKDRGLDFKLKLWQESYYLPELSLGVRDIAGTALFGSEYLAASKRFYDLDFTLGLGWGYLSNQQHIRNPFGRLNDKFYTRPADAGGEQGGKVATNAFFRGPYAAFFGGIEYHSPWRPLRFKLEYDANNYRHEPQDNPQEQKSPLNIGAVYRFGEALDVHVGYERGDTWMLGFTLRTNFQSDIAQTKQDPKPEPIAAETPAKDTSMAQLAQTLSDGGFQVQRIREEPPDTLALYGVETRYRNSDQAIDRRARQIANRAPRHHSRLAFVNESHSMAKTRTEFERDDFESYARYEQDTFTPKRVRESVEQPSGATLFKSPPSDPSFNFIPDLNQSIGGPDDFYLYQITANAGLDYRLTPGWELSGTLSANIINNFDQFRYTAPSNLPRVRTYIREYLKGSDVNLKNLQLTHFRRLTDELYSQWYAGYLEFMYAGLGGEILYLPNGAAWALSANVNAVQQREFEQHLGLRDYRTTTGHVNAYYQTGLHGVLAKLSVGRYLAKDKGFTLDFSREFSSGIVAGVYATFTDVSAADYGEGSFTKGFYLTIPFDTFFVHSTTRKGRLTWSPLTRDGGQSLLRKYELYELYR